MSIQLSRLSLRQLDVSHIAVRGRDGRAFASLWPPWKTRVALEVEATVLDLTAVENQYLFGFRKISH